VAAGAGVELLDGVYSEDDEVGAGGVYCEVQLLEEEDGAGACQEDEDDQKLELQLELGLGASYEDVQEDDEADVTTPMACLTRTVQDGVGALDHVELLSTH